MQRYLKWSDRWRGHEDLLEYRKPGELGSSEEAALGKALVRAVMANQGWIPTDGELAEAAQHCVGKDACGEAADIRQKSAVKPVAISFWDVGQDPQLTLAQFTPSTMTLLEEKIKQFPRGTQFEVNQFAEMKIKNQVLMQRILKMLEDAGMDARSAGIEP
jgi:hypothetical protein